MNNPYETLNVKSDATDEEIKKSYRSLARKYHPDVNTTDPEADAKFKEIQNAYDILSDAEKKNYFDLYGTTQKGSANSKKPFTSAWDDFFSNMFKQQQQVVSGDHIQLNVEITLDQVNTGDEIDVSYKRKNRCTRCQGSGGTLEKCSACNGTGSKVIHGKAMTVKSTCQNCGGAGSTITVACDDCNSGFVESKEEIFNFNIPPGVESGMRFVQQGMGDPSQDPNGVPGNLYVHIHVKEHELFKRRENGNLIFQLPVTYSQLVLGDSIEIPTISGKKALFKIPAGSQPSSKFKLTGLGLPIFNNGANTYHRGDQIVHIKLEVPKQIDGRYKEIITELAEIEKNTSKEESAKTGDESGRT